MGSHFAPSEAGGNGFAPWNTEHVGCSGFQRASGRGLVALDPLVHVHGALVPAVAEALLRGALEQAADAEDLRLVDQLGHAADAAAVADRLDLEGALLAEEASDSALIHGTFSAADGAYYFENVPAGIFVVAGSMLGFEQNFSERIVLNEVNAHRIAGQMVLKESSATLSEITVAAKLPFLEQKIDRTVINVANSITRAGGNALEVLQRSPGVQVNSLTKTISLAGKEGVVIMINGKISQLPADAVLGLLAGMNADNIERIELIHTPPAQFDAEGNAGIIHIILKSTGNEGFNGGYSCKAGYGRGEKLGGSVYFNFRKKKINLFGNYDYDYDLNPQVFTNYRRVLQGSDVLETDTRSERLYTPTSTQNARVGMDVELSPRTVVGAIGIFFDRNWYMEAVGYTRYLRNGIVDSLLRMPVTETNHNRSFSGNINLMHRFSAAQSLSVDADLIHYDIYNPSTYQLENSDRNGALTSEGALRIDKKTPIRVMVAKSDYTIALGENAKLETGVKITALRFDNDVQVDSRASGKDWVVVPDFTSLFYLDEDVAGAYGTFSSKIGDKTDIKTGLRYEFTRTHLGSETEPDVVNRRYDSWFPSVFLSHKWSENQQVNISYSRRITRPPIRNLAPWLIFSDPTTLEGGNPALQSSFTDAFSINYGFKSWQAGLSYSVEQGPMRYLPMINTQYNRQQNRIENLESEKLASAHLSFPLRLAKWWEMRQNFFVNTREILFQLEGKNLRVGNVDYGFNIMQTFTLPRNVSIEIAGTYNSPSYSGVGFWKATGSLDIGIEKKLGEQWGKLRFSASDLFLSSNWYGETRQPDVNLYVKRSFQFSERTFVLSWSNTFGSKKLRAARNRQTGSVEEMRRI